MPDSEWYGEPHTLIVRSVEPAGTSGYGELDYDLEHPPSCAKKACTYEFAAPGDESTVEEWDCDVAQHEAESGLAGSLHYSGTPVTEPGTYRIQGWGRKTYYWGSGHEYDCGVGVMDPEAGGDDAA